MAILASAQWWVRAGGNALNGGGYDAAISGAGTNYCDQDAAQLSLTDFATSGAGSTTLTSATGGFTSQMVGNCIRIASGTNFQAGYYFVTVYTDANTVTLDRTPTSGGAGSGGTGRLGGALANVALSLSTGGTVTAPTLTSPLAAGHTINIRGAGTTDPASADYTQTGYASYPNGSAATGMIRFKGYNGRPRIDCNDIFDNAGQYHRYEDLVIVCTGAGNPANGRIDGSTSVIHVARCKIDQAGHDVVGIKAQVMIGCDLVNSGSTAAGTRNALVPTLYAVIIGCRVDGWRGPILTTMETSSVIGNVFSNCRAASPAVAPSFGSTYPSAFVGNTLYGHADDAIGIGDANADVALVAMNNIIYGNGGYGIQGFGSAALNALRSFGCDFNAFGDNTLGDLSAIPAGDNDITLTVDPFTNAAGGDFTLNSTPGGGGDIDDTAFPTSIP